MFDESYRLTEKEVEAAAKEGTPGATQSDAAYLHERYIANERIVEVGASRRKVGAKARTLKVEQGWRRIDRDWLSYAGALAMKLDEDTNNTSLVLAIELAGSGQVLLFPGDAQVGNWLSWDGCSWTVKEAGKPDRTVSAADLLGRTVLYKVGHHGSHNATLKALGLERMNGKRLVAMIPVDEAVAKKQGKFGWKMPFEPLLRALETKTEGRVLRADGAMPVVAGPEKKWFASAAKVTPLYAELMVKDE